jgi:DNA repair protein RecO (recombination protein O)
MLTKDIAICIRVVDYSETSQIVTFFTRANGKISTIAKGSKRPKSVFDGPIEILSSGKIVFSDSSKEKLATLTEFEQQPGFARLGRSLFALNCASFAAELVNRLTDDYDPHPGLFDSFVQFLQSASEHWTLSIEHREMLSLLVLFQLTLLKEIGLQPVFSCCANCKTRYDIPDTPAAAGAGLPPRKRGYESYFSSSANGLVCRDCEGSFPDKIRLTKDAAACLANLRLLAQSDEKTLSEIEKVLISHIISLLGRPLKMTKQMLKNLNGRM